MSRGPLLAAVVVASLAPAAAQQPRSTFRSETSLVHFGVTITDKKGNAVSGLTAEDFEIVEDGQPQMLRYFAQGDDAAAPELHVGLMFDTSESMAEDLSDSRTAAIRFLNRFPEAKDLTLVDFATEVRVGRFSQDDFPRLVERIRSRPVDGLTALYDAFVIYLDGAAGDAGRTILVAFTDGGDSHSTTGFSDLVRIVRASNATIYVVGFLEHQSSSTRGEQQLRLMRIADESGGLAIFPRSMKQIDPAYDQIVAEIHAQYSLGYVSTNTRRDGRWREVRIRLRPGLKDLRVRARGGYFAPVNPS